ncbi:MAG: hypothetical protein ACOX7D_00755 [Alphaproteobacteria bacterium]|jgi:hypothetical protein|nr:hypothetical protein [Alphaproteobacteria bacterium]
MTKEEFLSWAKSSGAIMLQTANDNEIAQTQNALQQMQAAIIPITLIEFYKNTTGGILLGDAQIFGLSEIKRDKTGIYYIPSVLQINRDFAGLPNIYGKTIFGRNGLFWLAFDAFGKCFLLNNITLGSMRKYDNIFKAMIDCLAVGKI